MRGDSTANARTEKTSAGAHELPDDVADADRHREGLQGMSTHDMAELPRPALDRAPGQRLEPVVGIARHVVGAAAETAHAHFGVLGKPFRGVLRRIHHPTFTLVCHRSPPDIQVHHGVEFTASDAPAERVRWRAAPPATAGARRSPRRDRPDRVAARARCADGSPRGRSRAPARPTRAAWPLARPRTRAPTTDRRAWPRAGCGARR